MSNKYFVREDTKLRLKEEYQKLYDKGELTEDELYRDQKKYHEQYRDFSVATYNNVGQMYTIQSGFKTFDEAKAFGVKHREENK